MILYVDIIASGDICCVYDNLADWMIKSLSIAKFEHYLDFVRVRFMPFGTFLEEVENVLW